MLKRIRVDDNGDTSMFAGSLVDIHEFNEENEKIKEKGLRPATGTRALLGITKASLATESFLSAASFQDVRHQDQRRQCSRLHALSLRRVLQQLLCYAVSAVRVIRV